MKITLVVFFLTAFLGMLFAGITREVREGHESVYAFGLQHVEPKIMIESETQEPNGTILTESLATGGTVYGTVEADHLTVYGNISVDGPVFIGNRLWRPLGSFVLSSTGNHDAAAGKPTIIWKDVQVRGALTIHGSLIVHGYLSPLGNMSIGGVMGPACRPWKILFPAGAYSIASAVDFGCPTAISD